MCCNFGHTSRQRTTRHDHKDEVTAYSLLHVLWEAAQEDLPASPYQSIPASRAVWIRGVQQPSHTKITIDTEYTADGFMQKYIGHARPN